MKKNYLIVFLIIYVGAFSQNQFTNLFIQNKGQVNAYKGESKQVLFELNSKNTIVWVTNKGLVFNFYEIKKNKKNNKENNFEIKDEPIVNWCRTELEFKGSEIDLKNCVKTGESNSEINFYKANLTASTKAYNDLYFKNIYKGIDWHLYTIEGVLKQEFIVNAGADVKQLQLMYKNNKGFEVKNSSITFNTTFGSYTESGLKSLQEKKEVPSNYKVISQTNKNGIFTQLISFNVPKYDKAKTLVIDPILHWCTFFGANVDEDIHAVNADASNSYFVGHSNSFSFPTLNPGSGAYFQGSQAGNGDAVVLKFNSNHNLIWATYFGGTLGEESTAITSNSNTIWVTGYTNSTDLPLMNPGSGAYYQPTFAGVTDAFILKFNTNGNLLWSTYVGGASNDYYSSIEENNGTIFLAGASTSSNFPTFNAGTFFQTYNSNNDIIISKFNTSNVLTWSTFFGGTGNDLAYSIKSNSTSVYICGNTNSSNFNILSAGTFTQNTLGGGFDGYVSKFNLNGSLQWSTLFGGNANDRYNSLCLNATCVWLCGTSASTNIPLANAGSGAFYQPTNAGINDGFVTKFTLNGSLKHSTYYGGTGNEYLMSCTTDGETIFTGGYTSSNTLTLLNPGGGAFFQGTTGGFNDACLQKFDTSGVLKWATYFGDASNDYIDGVFCNGSKLYVCGYSQSNFLPTVNPGSGAFYQSITNGSNEGYVAAFKNCTNPTLTITTNSPVCIGGNLILSANSVPNSTYQWFGPNSFNSFLQSPTLTALTASNAGVYSLIVNTTYSCSASNIYTVNITPSPTANISSSGNNCENGTLFLSTSPATSYIWQGPNSFSSTNQNPTVVNTTTANTGNYSLTVVNAQGCSNSTSSLITINPLPNLVTSSSYTMCASGNLTLAASGANTYSWTGPNSYTSSVPNNTISNVNALSSGNYFLTGTSAAGCVSTSSLTILVSVCSSIKNNTQLQTACVINTASNFELLNIDVNNFEFKLFELSGKLLFETNTETAFKINLSKGIYIVSLKNGNEYINKRLVIDGN